MKEKERKRMIKGQLYRHVIEQEFKCKVRMTTNEISEIRIEHPRCFTYNHIRNRCLMYPWYLPGVRLMFLK